MADDELRALRATLNEHLLADAGTRAAPRLTALEGEMKNVCDAVRELGTTQKAQTVAFDALAGEIRTEREARAAEFARKAKAADEEAEREKQDRADFRRQLRTLSTHPAVLAALFGLLTAAGFVKSAADRESALAETSAQVERVLDMVERLDQEQDGPSDAVPTDAVGRP